GGVSKTLVSARASGSSTTPPPADVAMVACGFGSVDEVTACAPAGKVALISRGPVGMGALFYKDKIANARAGAAVGVVIYNHRGTDGALLPDVDTGGNQPVPIFTLAAGDGEKLAAEIKKGT